MDGVNYFKIFKRNFKMVPERTTDHGQTTGKLAAASRKYCFRHTFPNFDGGTSTEMMTSSMHLCVASLTYLL